MGQESLLDALKVGALIEEVDIDDIDHAIKRTSKRDLLQVYGNLIDGSFNHLRSFAGLIEELTGKHYTAQYLSQKVVNEILAD